MVLAAYVTTYTARSPYLTVAEYKAAATGVDTSQLIDGGSAAEQDAALATIIGRASSWADQICHQVLACTQETENPEISSDRWGSWHLSPKQWPVVELLAAKFRRVGTTSDTVLDVSTSTVQEKRITIPGTGLLGTSSVGPLQLGPSRGRVRGFLTYSYIAGWPNTTLTAAAAAGGTSITVDSPLGIYGTQTNEQVTAGTQLTIYDGANTEAIVVASLNGPNLTLTAPLQYNHTIGVSASAFPPAIKQAVVSLTSALVKTRGSEALVMQSMRDEPSKVEGFGESGALEDLKVAEALLTDFHSEVVQ